MTNQNLSEMLDDIATAPGDLPLNMIIERESLRAQQFRHDNIITPLAPTPNDFVEITATNGNSLPIMRAEVWYTTDGTLPNFQSRKVEMEITSVDWQPLTGYISLWKASIPAQPNGTTIRYKIAGWHKSTAINSPPGIFAMDGQGFWFNHAGENAITTFAYRVEQNPRKHPSWMDQAVIYHIFLDRFHPGTRDGKFQPNADAADFHGGTLKGVQLSLPYLADLGVNCLWFSPITLADTYHRYDLKDYFKIDPRLGTKEDLHALMNAAHQIGMRVLLDFVPCHCSWKHPAFLDAQKNRDSDSYPWFTFYEWPQKYRCFLDMAAFLPSFDTNDPGARKYIIDSALYWMREFEVDGYRLDHAIGHGMDFWVQFKNALETEDSNVVTIGEATDTPDSLQRFRGRLHDILDFPLARALRHTFASRDWSLSELDAFLASYDLYMQTGPGRVSFLDNHDMERFLFVAHNDLGSLKLAALCQFSLAQTPAVYYGTEIGMSHEKSFAELGFGGDTEARRDMPWDPDRWNHELLDFYQNLIRLRKEYPALHTPLRKTIHLDTETETYAYRCIQDDGPDIIAAFNLGGTSQELPLPEPNPQLLLVTNIDITLNQMILNLPANAGAWIICR